MGVTTFLIHFRQSLKSFLCCCRIGTDYATVPPHLPLVMFDISSWSTRRDCVLVPEYQNALVVTKESVDVFEASLGCFRVQEIYDGHKGEVENSPDYVEFPLQTLNAYWSYLDHCPVISLTTPSDCILQKGIPI